MRKTVIVAPLLLSCSIIVHSGDANSVVRESSERVKRFMLTSFEKGNQTRGTNISFSCLVDCAM